MKIRFVRFNIYLLSLLLICTACETTKETGTEKKLTKEEKKQLSLLRFHMEINSTGSDRTGSVAVYRLNPVYVSVEKNPFLDESNIAKAAVIDVMGGFAIQIQFDDHGTFVLDNATTGNRGRRVAVFSQFGDARWLAAPVVSQRIASGYFTFTPDATRQEAERIVRGVNNAVIMRKKRNYF